MMDTSQAREIVTAALKPMRWRLQLNMWDVDVRYRCLEDGLGTCTPEVKHDTAVIEIDSEEHESSDDILNTLRHELIHLMLANLETYRKAVGQLVDDKAFDALDEFWRHAVERTVLNFERCLDHGLGQTPAGMAEPVPDDDRVAV